MKLNVNNLHHPIVVEDEFTEDNMFSPNRTLKYVFL